MRLRGHKMNRSPKAESALRREIEKILTFVPDLLWKIARKENYVSEVLQGGRGANTPESLAKRLRDWMDTGGPQQQPAPRFIAPTLARRQRRGKTVQSHQGAVSDAIAEIVRQREDVRSFRRDVLHGQILKPEDVERWIEEHRRDGAYPHAVLVRLKTGFEFDDRDEFKLKPLLSSVEPEDIERFVSNDTLDYGKPGSDLTHSVPIDRDGSLRVVYEISRTLARLFCWQDAQATVFLLTDLTPMIDTELVGLSPPPVVTLPYGEVKPLACLARLTMTVDPLLTPREVSQKYAKLRSRCLVSKPRAMSQKHLELAVFATKHPAVDRDAMELWGREFPSWKYQRVSIFARDAREARARLLHRSPVDLRATLRPDRQPPIAHATKRK
jgi:hypothetical protein